MNELEENIDNIFENSSNNVASNVTPRPSPTFNRHIRFIEHLNADGSKTIEDADNNYIIHYTDENGYIAYNEEGKEVYHIFPDNTLSVKLNDGYEIVSHKNKLTIDNMSSNLKITDDLGEEYFISNGQIKKSIRHWDQDAGGDEERIYQYRENGQLDKIVSYQEGHITDEEIYDANRRMEKVLYYNDEGEISSEVICNPDGSFVSKAKNDIIYLDENFVPYRMENPDNSVTLWTRDNNSGRYELLLNPDGTYKKTNILDEEIESGKYTWSDDGYAVCEDSDGNKSFYSTTGEGLIKRVNKYGTTIYELEDKQKNIGKSGNVSYSITNHIEYDEGAYDTILKTLNYISCNNIKNSCHDIEDYISTFPDKYSNNDINIFESNIDSHFELIKALSEMTNYSILAYQTCDDELKDNLNLLVDSLFGDNDYVANIFKKIVSYDIEDVNGDNILKYKEDTNFLNLKEMVKFISEQTNCKIISYDEYIKDNKAYVPGETLFTQNGFIYSLEQSDIMGTILNKIDFSLIGYSNEEVLNYIYNNKDEDIWESMEKITYYTPSNFNDILQSADMTAYSFDELLEARGLDPYKSFTGEYRSPYVFDQKNGVVYYSHMVNINGDNIEFVVSVVDDIKDDPLKVASNFVKEVNGINQLSHYPSEQFKIIATPDPEQEGFWNSAKPWATIALLDGMNIGGGYYNGRKDVIINTNVSFSDTINAINHELGHKVDNMHGNEEYSDLSKTDKWRNLVYSNIETIERIENPDFVHNGDINDDGHICECMAEVNKVYSRYPDEFMIVAPELYEEYDNLVNPSHEDRKTIHTITINGKKIPCDNDADRAKYIGHQ